MSELRLVIPITPPSGNNYMRSRVVFLNGSILVEDGFARYGMKDKNEITITAVKVDAKMGHWWQADITFSISGWPEISREAINEAVAGNTVKAIRELRFLIAEAKITTVPNLILKGGVQ